MHSVAPYRLINLAPGQAFIHCFKWPIGNTSPPKAITFRYSGFAMSKADSLVNMVRAEDTKQIVFILCSLRYSMSITGDINSFLGIKYVAAPYFSVV